MNLIGARAAAQILCFVPNYAKFKYMYKQAPQYKNPEPSLFSYMYL